MYYLSHLLAFYILIENGWCQQCLSSPHQLPWSCSNGICSGQLTYDAQTFTVNGVTFTTRVHNNAFPSPTLRMHSGHTYELTLINNLGDEPIGSSINTIKEVNYTNIHTHGVHISGESPADDIFNIVAPGGNIVYTYHIPCDHSGGTMWYHPHHHGSTAVQVGGGAAGTVIIEDNANEMSSFPSWYTQLKNNELILVIQNLNLAKVAQLGSVVDELFETSSSTSFYTVNGIYQPTICLHSGEWRKLRIVHVDIESDATFILNGDSCDVYLLSKDGVLIHGSTGQTPRHIPSNQMYFTVSSRADVAIQCSDPGTYPLTQAVTTIAYIQVTNESTTATALHPFIPIRPPYLHSLVNYDGVYNTKRIGMSARTILGQSFSTPNTYLFTITAGSVNEWNIKGAGAHPFHVHINHFQIQSVSGGTGSIGPPGWTEIGDWLDTLDANAVVRFTADRFGGRAILHCHILEHEDEGAMGIVKIDGGCDGNKGNYGSEPVCDFSCSTAPTTSAPTTFSPTTSAPTTFAPTTIAPTLSPSPPTTSAPTTFAPTTSAPTTIAPTLSPTSPPITIQPQCKNVGATCSDNGECCSSNCRGRCKH